MSEEFIDCEIAYVSRGNFERLFEVSIEKVQYTYMLWLIENIATEIKHKQVALILWIR